MKIKYSSVLLAGLLAAGSAMAMTDVPAYTLSTSANLVGNLSVSDSGMTVQTWSEMLGQVNYTYVTTASVLSTFQDAISGQWYQKTQFTQTTAYDTLYRDYTYNARSIYLGIGESSGVAGDQWVDLSVNLSGPMNYTANANGIAGTQTSPRFGVAQVIYPALGVAVDGGAFTVAANNSFTPLEMSASNAWSALVSGTASNTFQAVVEATNGGVFRSLGVSFSTDFVLAGTHLVHSSYDMNSQTLDVAISAPVPEPETYAMLLAGLGLMGVVARRRQKTLS